MIKHQKVSKNCDHDCSKFFELDKTFHIVLKEVRTLPNLLFQFTHTYWKFNFDWYCCSIIYIILLYNWNFVKTMTSIILSVLSSRRILSIVFNTCCCIFCISGNAVFWKIFEKVNRAGAIWQIWVSKKLA